jgi:hypothetical protein
MTTSKPITELDLPRSIQAHGASARLGWGRCYPKAQMALKVLKRELYLCETICPVYNPVDKELSFWQGVSYCEGWHLTFSLSPYIDRPNEPRWLAHGFLLGPDDRVIDPLRGKAAVNWGSEDRTSYAWLPVFKGLNLPMMESPKYQRKLWAAREKFSQWAKDQALLHHSANYQQHVQADGCPQQPGDHTAQKACCLPGHREHRWKVP